MKEMQAVQKEEPALGLYHEGTLLGGSWVVISGAISRVTIDITYIRGLITPLITTHEPPSNPQSKIRNLAVAMKVWVGCETWRRLERKRCTAVYRVL